MMVQMMNVIWMNTLMAVWLLTLDEGRTSLARMTQKAMVMIRMEPWVTRRRIVDTLTPYLPTFGLKKEEMAPDEGWDSAADWLPLVLLIETGSCSETAGCGSLSAGCLAGIDVWRAVRSESDSSLEGAGGLRLSVYPNSPRLVGNGPGCG